MTATAAETIGRAAERMHLHVAAIRKDLADNPYWNGSDSNDDAWRIGVNSALGGPAGMFAAFWTPTATEAVAAWLDSVARAYPRISSPHPNGEVARALTVARAYLADEAAS